MDLSHMIRTAKSVITANSPALLVGTAIVGVITTGVLAAKGGYKARGIIDEAQAALPPEQELTVQDKVRLTWLCYAVPAVTGVSTVASVVGVHTIHTKRHTALAGLYAVTAHKMDDYRDKAEELLGTKKSQDLNNVLGQKSMDKTPFESKEVVIVENGNELCYDDWSGRYFMGSVPLIEKAFSEVNMRIVEVGDASVNDYYEAVGLPTIEMGQSFGWSGGKRTSPVFGNVTTMDGRPAISVGFRDTPTAI